MTKEANREELDRRPVFDPPLGAIHIQDLIEWAFKKDGRELVLLSDQQIGAITLAIHEREKIIPKTVKDRGADIFQSDFKQNAIVRKKRHHVGRPFLDPNGNLMKLDYWSYKKNQAGEVIKERRSWKHKMKNESWTAYHHKTGKKVGKYNVSNVHYHPNYKEWRSKLLFAGKRRSDHGHDIQEVVDSVEREIQVYKNKKQSVVEKYDQSEDMSYYEYKDSEESEDSEEENFLRSQQRRYETRNHSEQSAQHNRPALQAEEGSGVNVDLELVPVQRKRPRINQNQEADQRRVLKVEAEEEDADDVIFVATRSTQRSDKVQQDIAQPQHREESSQGEQKQPQDKFATLLEFYGKMGSADLDLHRAASSAVLQQRAQQ